MRLIHVTYTVILTALVVVVLLQYGALQQLEERQYMLANDLGWFTNAYAGDRNAWQDLDMTPAEGRAFEEGWDGYQAFKADTLKTLSPNF